MTRFIVDLRKNCPNASVTGIRVKDELATEIGVCQDASSRQVCSELIKSALALISPHEGRCLLGQTMEGTSDPRKILDESAVVARQPQELLNFSLRCQRRPGGNLLDLRRVRGHTVTGDDVAQVVHFALKK